MKFTGTFTGIKLDLSSYMRQLEEHLTSELHRVANAWLQVVAGSRGRVPLWSGMARASLLELSELINGRIVLSPKRAKSRVPQGRALGTAIPKITSSSAFITIITDVEHYSVQEYQKLAIGSPRAPWHSLLAGELAYHEAARSTVLPPPILRPIKFRVI